MASPDLVHAGSLLPLLLSLPAGTIAGVPGDARAAPPELERDLARFGQRLRSDVELRHAARRPPPRVVVEFDSAATVVSDTGLTALAEGGSVVLLLSDDRGTLARLCHRILAPTESGPAWVDPGAVHASRILVLRVEQPHSERWLRMPLGDEGAEAALAAVRALGIVVRESRVDYGLAVPR
jgi:hypothetical protein